MFLRIVWYFGQYAAFNIILKIISHIEMVVFSLHVLVCLPLCKRKLQALFCTIFVLYTETKETNKLQLLTC